MWGKISVGTSEDELPGVENLWQRGNDNGLQGLRKLNPQQIKEIEPHAAGIAAIHVPQEGIVDYPAVCEKLGERICQRGGEIKLNARVLKIISDAEERVVETSAGNFRAKFLITCGGLQSHRFLKPA